MVCVLVFLLPVSGLLHCQCCYQYTREATMYHYHAECEKGEKIKNEVERAKKGIFILGLMSSSWVTFGVSFNLLCSCGIFIKHLSSARARKTNNQGSALQSVHYKNNTHWPLLNTCVYFYFFSLVFVPGQLYNFLFPSFFFLFLLTRPASTLATEEKNGLCSPYPVGPTMVFCCWNELIV